MRRHSVYNQQRGDLDVAMTPMIDVVFLLLVFFIWTASFQLVEHLLPSTVSAVAGTQASDSDTPPPEDDFDRVVVRILWSEAGPVWQVNESPVRSLPAVREILASIASVKSDAPVIVHPDPDVPIGDVIDVYDATRLEGFEKVQFAASEEI